MTEIITGRNPGEESLGNFLRLLVGGGPDQQRLAAQGAVAVGYLSQTELSANIQELVDSSGEVILQLMTDGNPQVRQTGMELAWSQYIGRRAARHAKELSLDVLSE